MDKKRISRDLRHKHKKVNVTMVIQADRFIYLFIYLGSEINSERKINSYINRRV
jgi:hypothetical protein